MLLVDNNAIDYTGTLDGYAPAEDLVQDEAKQELCTRLEMLLNDTIEFRNQSSMDWFIYDQYLKGNPVFFNSYTQELVRLAPEFNRRLRSQNNVLRPTIRSLVGKLTRIKPGIKVLPATQDYNEREGSKEAQSLLNYLRRILKLEIKYVDAYEHIPVYGNAFFQLLWDPDGGQEKAYCAECEAVLDKELIGEPCPVCEKEAEMVEQSNLMIQETAIQAEAQGIPVEEAPLQEPPKVEPMQAVREGQVAVDIVCVRDFFFDPSARRLEDCRWVMRQHLIPVQEARAMFPEYAKYLRPQNYIRERWPQSEDSENFGSIAYADKREDSGYLEEWHEAPTAEYPEGRIIWKWGDIVLREEKSEYRRIIGRYPFYHIGWDKNPLEILCEPALKNVWHRQRELNKNETFIREHVELVLKPKWLVPLSSRITHDEITSDSAQIIKYAAPHEPRQMNPPPIPQDVWSRGAALENSIRTGLSITGADIGQMGSDPNGRAMAIVQAEADSQLGPIMSRNNEEWKELHRGLLQLCQEYYHPNRSWSIEGPDDTPYTGYFYKMSLRDGWDLELEQDDGLSYNSQIRFNQTNTLAQIGYYTDPTTGQLDAKAFARAARLNLPGEGNEIDAMQRSHARLIPDQLQQGEQPTIELFDDPKIHSEELYAWLCGPGRRSDIKDQVQQYFMMYMQWAQTGQPPGMGASGPGPGGVVGEAQSPTPAGGGQPIQEEAGAIVAQADENAEQTATGGQPHES